MSKKTDSLQIIRRGNGFVPEGSGEGWLYERSYPTFWKAQIAVEVFFEGGKVSEYFRRARVEKQLRSNSSMSSKARREFRRKQTALHMKQTAIKEQIAAKPDQAETYLEMAVLLASTSPAFSKVTSTKSTIWDEMLYPNHFSVDLKQAKKYLNTSLALGLTSDLDTAKSKYLLISILISELANGQTISLNNLHRYPRITALAADAIKDLGRHLHLDPHDIHAMSFVLVSQTEAL